MSSYARLPDREKINLGPVSGAMWFQELRSRTQRDLGHVVNILKQRELSYAKLLTFIHTNVKFK